MGTSTRLILGVANLLLFLRPRVDTQHCSARINPPELDGPESWPINKPPFDMAFMSSFVHSFLSSVQPNPFPKGMFLSHIRSNMSLYFVLMQLCCVNMPNEKERRDCI